jgi:Helix-turn-helix
MIGPLFFGDGVHGADHFAEGFMEVAVAAGEPKRPAYRSGLKARMILAGYRNNTALARATEIDVARISKVVNGWEIPGADLQKRIAAALGISLRELRELL